MNNEKAIERLEGMKEDLLQSVDYDGTYDAECVAALEMAIEALKVIKTR